MRSLLISSILSLSLACTGMVGEPRDETAGNPAPSVPPSLEPEPQPGPVDPQTPPGTPHFLPAGIRRLTKAELQTAASALLGIPSPDLGTALGDDTRQSGFTRNADQRIGSVQADALWQAAQALAHQAVTTRLDALAPCTTAGGSEPCAQAFIHAFAPRAFRRALSPAEEAGLLTVYRAGASWAGGVELTITAVLQSASFLYVTELGRDSGNPTTTLSGEELATHLALLFTGAPADDALMTAGRAGALDTAQGREVAVRAMLATPASRTQLERLLLEWTGVDAVDQSGKDTGLFPEWPGVRADVLAESRSIINGVLFEGDGTLQSLLSTSRTNVSPALASFYGLTSSGPITQPAFRRGLLLAGGFAAANSHFTDTAPIKRAALVRKKLLCQELPLPAAANVVITVPPADPTLTTRERFTAHSANATCAGCHTLLDPIGYALASFDAVGRYRTTENGKPIDTTGALLNAGDADGAFTDAVGLSALLANSKSVAQCFQHQLFRFASGRSGIEEERTYLDFVRALPSGREGKVVELLVDYARSDSFATRRLQ